VSSASLASLYERPTAATLATCAKFGPQISARQFWPTNYCKRPPSFWLGGQFGANELERQLAELIGVANEASQLAASAPKGQVGR